MSRIGKKPINIPQSVTVSLDKDKVTVKSGSTQLVQAVPAGIKVSLKDQKLTVAAAKSDSQTRSLHGLTRSLLANMITGVTQGFTKTLEIQGTGYRVRPKDGGIELSLGFSHPIAYQPLPGIKLEIKDNNFIIVSGADKQLVGQTAAAIRNFRPPDSYKGKGIRYQGETVKLKPGKAAKAAAGIT